MWTHWRDAQGGHPGEPGFPVGCAGRGEGLTRPREQEARARGRAGLSGAPGFLAVCSSALRPHGPSRRPWGEALGGSAGVCPPCSAAVCPGPQQQGSEPRVREVQLWWRDLYRWPPPLAPLGTWS